MATMMMMMLLLMMVTMKTDGNRRKSCVIYTAVSELRDDSVPPADTEVLDSLATRNC